MIADPATSTRPHRPRRRDDDGDFPLVVARARPVIPPGIYDAKSTSVHRDRMYDRFVLRLGFMIFDGAYLDGAILAEEVDGFFAMGTDKKRPGPSTRIARLIQLLDPNSTLDDFTSNDLKNKLWKVRVVTVEKDRQGQDLHASNRYSKVSDVLERIA